MTETGNPGRSDDRSGGIHIEGNKEATHEGRVIPGSVAGLPNSETNRPFQEEIVIGDAVYTRDNLPQDFDFMAACAAVMRGEGGPQAKKEIEITYITDPTLVTQSQISALIQRAFPAGYEFVSKTVKIGGGEQTTLTFAPRKSVSAQRTETASTLRSPADSVTNVTTFAPRAEGRPQIISDLDDVTVDGDLITPGGSVTTTTVRGAVYEPGGIRTGTGGTGGRRPEQLQGAETTTTTAARLENFTIDQTTYTKEIIGNYTPEQLAEIPARLRAAVNEGRFVQFTFNRRTQLDLFVSTLDPIVRSAYRTHELYSSNNGDLVTYTLTPLKLPAAESVAPATPPGASAEAPAPAASEAAAPPPAPDATTATPPEAAPKNEGSALSRAADRFSQWLKRKQE